MKDKRFSSRFIINLPAQIWDQNGTTLLFETRLVDFSPTGCRISPEFQELTVGSIVKVKFGFEKSNPFFLDSQVVWGGHKEGKKLCGLKFVNPKAIEKEQLRKYIYDLKYGVRYTM